MKAVVAAFNQEKALVGAFSVITNLRMELFEALLSLCHVWRGVTILDRQAFQGGYVIHAQAQIPNPHHPWLKGSIWPWKPSSLYVDCWGNTSLSFMFCVQYECDEKCVESEDIRSYLY